MSTRNSITIATAGHVDHGKTALVNKITGVNTDTLLEEKSRGMSINLGFAYHHIKQITDGKETDLTIGFIDVPGHRDFINNALAGISVVDSALLIIAADDGIMPQTREHLAILDLLGIRNGAIAITKIDKCGVERIEELKQQIDLLVAGTSLSSAAVFPVSSINGEGIDELVNFLQEPLFKSASSLKANFNNPRFIIDRSFTVKGIGTVVTGTVHSGSVNVDTKFVHSRSNAEVRVKSLRHDQQLIHSATAGERIAINVNLPLQQIQRGDWLLDKQLYFPVFRMDVKLRLLIDTVFQPSVKYHMYHGASHHLVSIRQLSSENSTYFQIACHEPLFALHGDRFILRDPAAAKTIGGGEIVDIFIPRRGRSSAERLEVLQKLDQEAMPALKALLESQDTGVELENFLLARNFNAMHLDRLLEQLARDALTFEILSIKENSQRILLHQKFYQQFADAILQDLQKYHQSNSNQLGMSEPALSKSVAFRNSHLLFHAILEKLIAHDQIKRTGTLLHLPSHSVQLSVDEQNFMKKIRPALKQAGFLPPRTRELTEITGMDLRQLEKTLAQARKAGSLVQVAPNRHYLPETMMQLAEFTESLVQQENDGFSVIQFRDKIGIGRNLCIEILEYFDRIGFTRRDGNNRFLRTAKENLFEQSSNQGNA